MILIRPQTVTDAMLTSSNVSATTAAAYNAGATYALGDRVQVDATDSHLIYESLQGSNTNHTPATSPTWWALVGATNRWAMFDSTNSSQTSNADSIEVTIQASARVDAVALINISAATARVVMTDPIDGVVYDRTMDLTSESGITDYYEWFFEPVIRKSDVAFTGLPPYLNASITITLTDTGNTVACGACVVGMAREIGRTRLGSGVGIQDYSVKTVDDFGNYTVTERLFSKRGSFDINVDPAMVDELQRLLASYRATPVVWIGDESYGSTILLGFYKDFSIVIAWPTMAQCSLEIEGLV